jgi:hypothetical protein
VEGIWVQVQQAGKQQGTSNRERQGKDNDESPERGTGHPIQCISQKHKRQNQAAETHSPIPSAPNVNPCPTYNYRLQAISLKTSPVPPNPDGTEQCPERERDSERARFPKWNRFRAGPGVSRIKRAWQGGDRCERACQKNEPHG